MANNKNVYRVGQDNNGWEGKKSIFSHFMLSYTK